MLSGKLQRPTRNLVLNQVLPSDQQEMDRERKRQTTLLRLRLRHRWGPTSQSPLRRVQSGEDLPEGPPIADVRHLLRRLRVEPAEHEVLRQAMQATLIKLHELPTPTPPPNHIPNRHLLDPRHSQARRVELLAVRLRSQANA